MKHSNVTLGLALSLTALGGVAQAQVVAIDAPLSSNGGAVSGNRGDFAGALGKDFQVTSAITVLSLGAYDSGQNGFAPGTTIHVGLYSVTQATPPTGNITAGVPLATATFTSANQGTLGSNSAFRFLATAPLVLTPGTYQIEADGFNANDPFFDTSISPVNFVDNTGGGAITYGANRYGFSPNTFAPINNGLPATNYLSGSFTFTPQILPPVVPEPGALLVLPGLMIGTGLSLYRRKRRK